MTDNIEKKLIEEYWVSKLGNLQFDNLSTKHTISTQKITIPNNETGFFEKLTNKQPIAEFTLGLAIYSLLVKRYFIDFEGLIGTSDILIEDADSPKALIFSVSEHQSDNLKEYLHEVKNEVLEILKYKAYDSNQLNKKLKTTNLLDLTPFRFSYMEDNDNTSHKIFCFHFSKNTQEEIEISIAYSTTFIDDHVVQHFLKNAKNWISRLEKYIELPISKIPHLDEGEEINILKNFNTTQKNYPKDKTIVDLFEQQVIETPQNRAMIFGDKTYSYFELNTKVNQLANYLIHNFQMGKDKIVGVLQPKSDHALISILAILKTGAAYLPIDPNYPDQRINYIIQDSKLQLLICDHSRANEIDFSNKIDITNLPNQNLEDRNPGVVISPLDAAYVIYTSGSTGNPKGVVIAHTSNVNMSLDQAAELNVSGSDCIIWFASIAFDASVYEIMMALYSGACLAIPTSEDMAITDNLVAFLKTTQVTIATFPPSYLNLLNGDDISGLKSIITAGEAAHPQKAFEVTNLGINYFNAYGPTECAVCVSIHLVNEQDRSRNFIPIGKPIANLSAYILDQYLLPVPIGVEGTLYVSGVGLAKEYLNKPELTKEKFIANPFIEGDKIYNTGDIVKWLPDGTIKFVGRKDTQVKIRGHRVELGEIENTFLKVFKTSKQVVVSITKKNKEDVLVAYYTGEELDTILIRKELEKELPSYMIPTYFVRIPKLPVTVNGKINYKALPEITATKVDNDFYIAPQTTNEIKLVQIWEEIIGVQKIGVQDNFFALGGHSLKVTLLINKIKQHLGATIKVKDFFKNPTVEGIIKAMKKDMAGSIDKTTSRVAYPLTPSQNRLWILSQFDGGNAAYNIPIVVQLNGNLQVDTLEKSFKNLIQRHESLRTIFRNAEEKQVEQVILDQEDLDFSIRYTDLTATTDKDQYLSEIVKETYQYEFDLAKGPLLKADIIQLNKEENILVFCMHHIIGDGWSMQVFVNELSTIYNALLLDNEPQLDTLTIQYKDYAVWLLNQLEENTFKEKEQYWLQTLAGELPVLELPSYKVRPKIKTYNGASLNFEFTEEFYEQIDNYKIKNEMTLFMVLMSGLNGLFYRYTQSKDILLGTVVAGREHGDVENQIGLYLNTLAIRTEFENANNFTELAHLQKETLLEVYSNQEYPFDALIDKLNIKRNSSRSALFDVMVVLQNQHDLIDDNQMQFDGLDLIPYRNSDSITSKFDMTFSFTQENGKLYLNLEYNTDIYEATTVTNLVSHYESFLINAIKNEDKDLDLINYLNSDEEDQVLKKFNDTKLSYPRDKSIIDLFTEQVVKMPDQTALVFEEVQLTYKELDELTNSLANHIFVQQQIKIEDRIAISLQQSEWLIISILAVLKTGASYVPIDLDFPKERKRFIEEDCNCLFVIDENFIEFFKTTNSKNATPINKTNGALNAAYVMYTSGSTGKPKGVLVAHRSVIRLVKPCEYFPLSEKNILLSTGSISFDATIIEYFGTLLNGATLLVAKKENLLSPTSLKKIIEENKVNSFWMTASWFRQIVETQIDVFDTVEQIIVGGDVVSPFHTNKVLARNPDLKITNGYGPTENTTFSATYPIVQKDYITIPIGKPIANSTAYIVNSKHQINPVGIVGELCLAGDGLAKEYINQPELTDQKFVDNPFEQGKKMYKTGDLARWLPNGNIEFIGRKDSQVKIRGYRIEIGEIEHALLAQEYIGQAHVQIDELNSVKRIIAYIVSDSEVDKKQLRYKLLDFLPDYMIPNYFIILDQFPLTNNGKIDIRSLPKVSEKDIIKKEYTAPTSQIEVKVVAIWEEVLEANQIGVKDNFFEVGGNSIQAIKILGKINTAFDMDFSAKDFFTYQTISEFSQLVSFRTYNNQDQDDIINEEYEEITL